MYGGGAMPDGSRDTFRRKSGNDLEPPSPDSEEIRLINELKKRESH